MSRENVEIVRRGFEAFRARGVEAILDLIAPDFEMTTTPDLAVEPNTYRGAEGIREYFDSFYEVMDEVRIEPDEFIDAGEHVVVPGRLVARGSATGIEADQHVVMVWTLRDRQVIRVTPYASRDRAFAAAGLPPPEDD